MTMVPLAPLLAGLAFLAATPASGPPAAPPPPIAVVAHPSTPVTALSVRELARVYTGESSAFSGVCIQRQLGDAFFEAVTGRSSRAVGRRWVRLLLSGRVAEGPVSLRTDAEVLAYVRANPGAIGFVAAEAARTEGVRRIRIEGPGADSGGFVRAE